jgi:hypothetical protein
MKDFQKLRQHHQKIVTPHYHLLLVEELLEAAILMDK